MKSKNLSLKKIEYIIDKIFSYEISCKKILYIIENKELTKINNQQLRMLSTNFCNGGEEINQIKNLKN